METQPGVSRAEFLTRQARTRQLATDAGYAGVMVIGRAFYDRPGALAYLTNHFPPFPATGFGGSTRGLGHRILILPVEGASVLIVDSGYYRDDLVVADEIRVAPNLPAETAAALPTTPTI